MHLILIQGLFHGFDRFESSGVLLRVLWFLWFFICQFQLLTAIFNKWLFQNQYRIGHPTPICILIQATSVWPVNICLKCNLFISQYPRKVVTWSHHKETPGSWCPYQVIGYGPLLWHLNSAHFKEPALQFKAGNSVQILAFRGKY